MVIFFSNEDSARKALNTSNISLSYFICSLRQLSNGVSSLFALLLLLKHSEILFTLPCCLGFAICKTPIFFSFFFFWISSNEVLLMQLYRFNCKLYCSFAVRQVANLLVIQPSAPCTSSLRISPQEMLPNCLLKLLKSAFLKSRFSFCHP